MGACVACPTLNASSWQCQQDTCVIAACQEGHALIAGVCEPLVVLAEDASGYLDIQESGDLIAYRHTSNNIYYVYRESTNWVVEDLSWTDDVGLHVQASGAHIAAWDNNSIDWWECYSSSWSGNSWSVGGLPYVSSSPGSLQMNTYSGNMYFAYTTSDGAGVYFAIEDEDGYTTLNKAIGVANSRSPALLGTSIVAFANTDADSIQLAYRDGSSFSFETVATLDSNSPDIAIDGSDNNFRVAWTDGGLKYAHKDDDGQWQIEVLDENYAYDVSMASPYSNKTEIVYNSGGNFYYLRKTSSSEDWERYLVYDRSVTSPKILRNYDTHIAFIMAGKIYYLEMN
jgi:hypothetical protein